MKIKKEISPERDATIEIEVSVEETGDVFTEAIKKFRSEASIPGFRPGHVPLDLIRKRWGRELFSQKAEELAREHLIKALEQEKLEPAGRMEIDMIEYGEGKPLRFKVQFPLKPEVKLQKYKELRIVINDAEVSDADVDNELEHIRQQHATLISIDDPAPAEARLTVKFQEVDPSGLPLIGRPVEEKVFELGSDELGISGDEQLVGIKAGEKRVIRVIPEAGALSQAPIPSAIITPGQSEDSRGATNEQHLSVEAIKVEVSELPEIDDDFAKLVNESLESVDKLRELIKYRIMSYVESYRHRELENGLIDRLIEDNPFPISKSVVTTTLEEIAENMNLEGDKKQDLIDQHFNTAENDLRWVMLRDETAKVENIEVTDSEIEDELKHIAEQKGEALDEVRKKLESQGGIDRIRKSMLERRVIDFLAKNAEIEKRTMSLDEFIRLTRSKVEAEA
ncbi:trigger factor [bacterium]|nr:trigger factor [bacterium]